MQNYINQLIEDLEEVAQNPPAAPYIEIPPHLSADPVIAELALSGYKTIEKWTGIEEEVFPEMIQLTASQCIQVNKAIFKVYDSLHLELVDEPEDFPPELLYEVLIFNWDFPVQYLPSSGMDVEFCTGDPMTCPYGEFCTCNEDYEDIDDIEEYDIPPRFNKIIPKIASSIDIGFVCYLNADTLDINKIPQPLINNPDEDKMITGVDMKDEDMKHLDWDSCFTFEPLESPESYKIMEDFVNKMEESALQKQLLNVINRPGPFANFNQSIDNSAQSENWFRFKQEWLEKHVKQIIWNEFNDLPDNFLDFD